MRIGGTAMPMRHERQLVPCANFVGASVFKLFAPLLALISGLRRRLCLVLQELRGGHNGGAKVSKPPGRDEEHLHTQGLGGSLRSPVVALQ